MANIKKSIFGGIIVPIIILVAGSIMVFVSPSSMLCLFETETTIGIIYDLDITQNGYNFRVKYEYNGEMYDNGVNIKRNELFFFSYIGSVKYKEGENIKVRFLKKYPTIMDVRIYKPVVAFFITIACLILSIASFKKEWLDATSI